MAGRKRMQRSAVLLVIAAVPQLALAQPFPADDSLNPTQRLGRDLFTQHCVVCHVRTQISAAGHFGPDLSGRSLGGKEDVMVDVISNGTPNMPGFRYVFEPEQIRAIAAYVKTLPMPARKTPTPDPATQGRASDD
jgi:mono/diheme cytochrome c family protein